MSTKQALATAADAAEVPTTDAEIADLLAKFAPVAAPKPSKAEAMRLTRIGQFEDHIRAAARLLNSLAGQTEDKKALADTLKSLVTVQQRATRAISGVPDSVLDPDLFEAESTKEAL